jgi:hypothetical protein
VSNWYAADPSRLSPFSPERTRQLQAEYEDWTIAELMRGERFVPSTAAASPAPTRSADGPSNAATAPSQPGWLTGAQWRETPQSVPWPEPPLLPRTPFSEEPSEGAAFGLRRPTPRRSPMGPPFLNEAPQGYPSHLGPVPRAPDWEQVVSGDTPWSPVAPPRRATDWGRVLTGVECRRTEDGGHINCITPGGLRVRVLAEDFPDYIGPGQPNYHYYNVPVGGARVDPRHLMQGLIDNPTPGPRHMVRPATPEGTINEATPEAFYYAATRPALPGTPFNSVRSHLTHDQYGRPLMVNVTRPGHQLAPGVVIRYVTTGPSGSTIQNEGSGLGAWQAPYGLSVRLGIADSINNVWDAQSRAIIEQQLRRRRR